MNAAGIIIIVYLKSDMISDSIPFPRPSNAPDAVTDNVDTIKPGHMMRSAVAPACMVAVFIEKRPISLSGSIRHMTA